MLSTTWASCSSKRDLPDEQRDHTGGKNTPDCRDKDAQCSINCDLGVEFSGVKVLCNCSNFLCSIIRHCPG